MIRWKTYDGAEVPRPVECESRKILDQDADGDTQAVNTHFDDLESAWEKGRQSVTAGIMLASRDVERLEEELAQAKEEMVQAGMKMARFRRERRRYDQDPEMWEAAALRRRPDNAIRVQAGPPPRIVEVR